MNTPPLIRPLRPLRQLLQGRQQLAAGRAVQNVFATSQRRWNSSEAPAASSAPPQRSASATTEGDLTSPDGGPINTRLPRTVETLHLRPLRRVAKYGVPTADLQLRSYSVRPLEFFCDFALRAAYYLNLPAYGPVPLPRITERWTVPRSNFIFKKSQENFERITCRRLIQIRDGHAESVQMWLAFLTKHAIPGVGMKANVWEYSKLDVGKAMDEMMAEAEGAVEPWWQLLGENKTPETVQKVEEFLASERFRAAEGR